jgi:hypothetical protein
MLILRGSDAGENAHEIERKQSYKSFADDIVALPQVAFDHADA